MLPVPVDIRPLFILLALCLVALPIVHLTGRVSAAQAGWRWAGGAAVWLGIGWGGLLATAGVAWLVFQINTHNYILFPATPRPVDWLLLVLAVPLIEEPLFRGAVFGGLQRTWQPFWAYLLATTLFVAAHPDWTWLLFLFLCGLGYAAAFRRAQSLAAPITAHMLVNATLLAVRAHPTLLAAIPLRALPYAASAMLVVIIAASLRLRALETK
jgi:membrane protease YdiL (CAAX protease family)